MQKIVRRTALARNQAQRKAIRADKSARRDELKDTLRQRFAYNRIELDNIRAERLRRREDWMRGPLAPQRDAGFEGKSFGALSPQAMRPPAIPKHLRRKYINFAPGDRVCIMKGRDKGKIEVVTRVDAENETLTVKDLNMVSLEALIPVPDQGLTVYDFRPMSTSPNGSANNMATRHPSRPFPSPSPLTTCVSLLPSTTRPQAKPAT